jgi:hypothetical protein
MMLNKKRSCYNMVSPYSWYQWVAGDEYRSLAARLREQGARKNCA